MLHYTAVIIHPTVRRHTISMLATDYQDAQRQAREYCEEMGTPDSSDIPKAVIYCAEDDDDDIDFRF